MNPLNLAWGAAFALLGMVFGSFSSLLSYRLPRDLPVGMTRSACPSCHHVLAARDLVPLLGYVFQHGHCRWCQKAISRRYPLMELTCALLFVVAFMAFGASLSGVLFAGLSFALLVVVVSDLETYIIPDTMVILVGVLGILWRWKVVPGFGDAFLGALLGGGLTLGLRALFLLLRRKQGLGLGDVKFIAVAGIWLGFEALPWLLVLGGSFGVVFGMAWQARNRLCRKKRTSRRKLPSYFPFGPALAFALYLLVLIQQRGYPWF